MHVHIASSLLRYLADQDIRYDLITHPPTQTSAETAQKARVPGRELAKAVVVEDEDAGRYAVVVLPSAEQLHLGELRRVLGAACKLASEDAVTRLFPDCRGGSVPPFGQAYDLDVLVDETLLGCGRVFAETGVQGTLLGLDGPSFRRLMRGARRGRYGGRPSLERVGHGALPSQRIR